MALALVLNSSMISSMIWALTPSMKMTQTGLQAAGERPTDHGSRAAPTAWGARSGDSHTLDVFFDGSCPLCRREISFLKARDRHDRLNLIDVSEREADPAPGLSCSAAMARMHVRNADGTIESGARAFLAIWGAIDRFRPLVRGLSIPPLPWVLEGGYRAFLLLRPTLQAGARYLDRKERRRANRAH